MEYQVESLPEVDQRHIERGYCPWCLGNLFDASLYNDLLVEHKNCDYCPGCMDSFCGSLTIDD